MLNFSQQNTIPKWHLNICNFKEWNKRYGNKFNSFVLFWKVPSSSFLDYFCFMKDKMGLFITLIKSLVQHVNSAKHTIKMFQYLKNLNKLH